jgi:hypothetical protein
MAEQVPSRILFLIAGNAGHGKDTFARFLKEIIAPWTEVHTTSYAYGIKKILHDNYNVPWEILEGDKDVKETSYIYVGAEKTGLTVRRALQKIGQFHRETFGATCWAASALTRCVQSSARASVITDARHPAEEIHWISKQSEVAGFLPIPVRVRRKSVAVLADHPSESLILSEPDGSFSFVVENDGGLEDLRKMAEQVACAAVTLQKNGKRKLKKKDVAFLVRRPDGQTAYEPLSESEASLLAVPPNTIERVDFDLLKGAACGH